MRFLKTFYKEAYETLRAVMDPEKLIVFHDGFRLSHWKDFFVKNGMKNVMLDVHVYLWVLDRNRCTQRAWIAGTCAAAGATGGCRRTCGETVVYREKLPGGYSSPAPFTKARLRRFPLLRSSFLLIKWRSLRTFL